MSEPGDDHERKIEHHPFEKLYPIFERVVVNVLSITLMIAVVYATLVFVGTLAAAILSTDVVGTLSDATRNGRPIGESILPLQEDMFDVFGGFLLILLGIELISMVRAMVGGTHVAVESILSIALIASARHVITIDVHHTEPGVLFGAGFVVFVLIIGFYLLRRDRWSGLRRNSGAARAPEPSGTDR